MCGSEAARSAPVIQATKSQRRLARCQSRGRVGGTSGRAGRRRADETSPATYGSMHADRCQPYVKITTPGRQAAGRPSIDGGQHEAGRKDSTRDS